MNHYSKPYICQLRRSKPLGPIKGCENTCNSFDACVRHSQNEKEFEDYKQKEIERLHAQGMDVEENNET